MGSVSLGIRREVQDYILGQDKRWDVPETPAERAVHNHKAVMEAMLACARCACYYDQRTAGCGCDCHGEPGSHY